jgi:toxin ParE1/3/4
VRVYWTRHANAQLVAIHDYIERESPPYARAMVDRLTRRSQQIGEFPFSGRVVPEIGRDDVREVFETPYRIIYRVKSDRIDVLAVIHGARLLPPEL